MSKPRISRAGWAWINGRVVPVISTWSLAETCEPSRADRELAAALLDPNGPAWYSDFEADWRCTLEVEADDDGELGGEVRDGE